jgi:hypothetical protein
MTHEQLVAAGVASRDSQSPERRAEIAGLQWEGIGIEERKRIQRARAATLTPEQRRAKSLKGARSQTSEERRTKSLKGAKSQTSEERRAKALKGWETRRKKSA